MELAHPVLAQWVLRGAADGRFLDSLPLLYILFFLLWLPETLQTRDSPPETPLLPSKHLLFVVFLSVSAPVLSTILFPLSFEGILDTNYIKIGWLWLETLKHASLYMFLAFSSCFSSLDSALLNLSSFPSIRKANVEQFLQLWPGEVRAFHYRVSSFTVN